MGNEIELDPPETMRRYNFPGGDIVVLFNVVKIRVTDTTHRLETAEGMKHIVPNGWIHIEIEVPEWTF